MRKYASAIGLGAVVLAVAIYWLRPSGDRPGGPAALRDPAPAVSVAAAPKSNPSSPVVPTSLPASLRGTSEDGALVVDDAGRFVVTSDAIDLFDYYLAATGEESDDAIYARIVAAIDRQLTGQAAIVARNLLDDYLAYRERASELMSGYTLGEDTARRLQYIRELRRDVFGEEVAQGLFGEEEARWFADIERQFVMADETLSPDERAERLAAIEADQPAEVSARHADATVHRSLRDDEARLRAEGADAGEIAMYREEKFGVEGAGRLSELDATREQWQSRLSAYRSDRDQQLADLPTEDASRLIEEIRSRHFSDRELIRVRALDNIESNSK